MAKSVTSAAAGRDRCDIAFAGGGTAGHVFPGLAIAEELGRRILWIGSSTGVERNLVGEAGIDFRGIPPGKLRRYVSFRNFSDMAKTVAGIFASLKILARERPALLFSKGGFVSVPPVIAARLCGNSFMDSRIRFRPRACHQDQPAFLRKGARFLLTDRRLSSGPVSEQSDRHRQPRAESPLRGRCPAEVGPLYGADLRRPWSLSSAEAWVPRSSTA